MSSAPFELNHEMVKAGAGAGKTTTLTLKVMETALGFYHAHGCFPRMVVTTFTRKATQELRERLIVEAVKINRGDFLDYISSRSNLHISTIHGVLSLFLRRYGHLLQLDSGFKVLSETEGNYLAKSILRKMLLDNSKMVEYLELWTVNELVSMLRQFHTLVLENPDSQPASMPDYPQLFQTLVAPTMNTLKKVVDKASAETENKKWQEYFVRLRDVITSIECLRSEADWSGLEESFRLLGRKPNFSSKKVGSAFSETYKDDLDRSLKKLKDFIKKSGVSASDWRKASEMASRFLKLAKEFHQQFTDLKCQSGQLEMGDLELLARESLRLQPQVGEAFSQEWDFWLIDEYQDTSPLQVELLRILIGDKKSFVVGDPQQSIYLFRGARSEVFQKKWQEVSELGGELREKMVNYRSDPSLLLFFNEVFAKVGGQFISMEPKSQKVQTSKPVAVFALAKDYSLADASDNSEQAAIVQRIEELRSEGAEFQDICLLGRSNAHLSELARNLQSLGYPIHLHAAQGFYDRREIRDALALLRFLLNPHDNVNLLTLLRSPFFRISDSELGQVMQNLQRSLWEILRTTKSPSVLRLKGYLEMAQEWGTSWAFQRAVLDSGIYDVSSHYDGTGRREANLWKLIKQVKELERTPGSRFLNLAESVGREMDPDECGTESDAVTALEPDRINLMTVHSSKGLQFPHIFLPRCDKVPQGQSNQFFGVDEDSGLWGISWRGPHDGERISSLPEVVAQSRRQQRELEESERLLYVALTRAEKSVFISWSGKVGSGSWAQKLACWADSSGEFKTENFNYRVETGPWTVRPNFTELGQGVVIPKPLALAEDRSSCLDVETRFSVSEYLEEKMALFQTEQIRLEVDQIQLRVRASNEGILIHRLMETLHYNWDFDFETVVENWFGRQADKARKAIEFVRNSQEPPLKELIQNGQVEWGFQVPTAKGILEGQIDLWGQDSKGLIWLVDYKSGLDKYIDKAFHQLSLYSLALRILGYEEQIKLAVVYVLSGKSCIQEAPSGDELRKIFNELF